jgi:predicted ATPase
MHASGSFPLVGREEDFGSLWDTYSSMGKGPRLLLVEGEAGIGKTALAFEFAQRVEAGGGRVVSVRAYEEEQGIAYGPVAQALRSGLESGGNLDGVPVVWLSEAARLVPEIDVAQGEPHTDPGAPARFLEGVARCLAAACNSDPPGVLLLDDAQWADASTLQVLAFLLRRVNARLCLLVTFRSGEVEPGHLLRRMLLEATPDARGVHLTLGRLLPSDVTQLVQSVAPAVSAGDPKLVERLYRESEGVPYFIVEYLASMKDGTQPDWDVPPTVKELVLARVRACSALAGQVLAAAATAGRSFDFDGLRAASGRSDEETVSALEELSERRLVTEVPSDSAMPTYDFVHEKVREVVYSETSLARRRILHARIADAMTKSPLEVPGAVAHHLLAAGREPEAALAFEKAGRQAASLYANAEARDHFMIALGLGYPDDASLHEALGDLDTLAGAYGDALARYEAAAALGDGSRIPELERKLADVHVRLGDYAAADSHLEAALDLLDPHESQLARILADRSLVSERVGDEVRARALADESLLEAERSRDDGALAQAHNILGILDKRAGKVEDSVAHLERSLEIAESGGDETARAAALNNLALAAGSGGDHGRALELATRALELCAKLGDRHREAALHSNVADLLHIQGRADEAMAHLKQGAAILAEVGEPGVMHPEVFKLTEW